MGITYQDICVVIPALNESAAIGGVLTDLAREMPGAEITVIDDGSSDGTASAAGSAGAKVITHSRTRGYGASLKTGIKATSRPYVLSMDGDGQHTAADARRLIESSNGADMTVGVRGNDSHVQHCRKPGKFILRWYANWLAGERIPDVNSGMRLVRRDAILKYMHLMPDGFSFSTTSTFAFLKGGLRINWVPIQARARNGKSSVRQWKHGPQTLLLILRLTVLFEPLRVFLAFDAVLLTLTVFSFVIDIIENQRFGIGEVTVTLSIATLLVFLFGLLCDQVSALRRELHD